MKKILILSLSTVLCSHLFATDETTAVSTTPETSNGMDVKVNFEGDETKDFLNLLKELNKDAINKQQNQQNTQMMDPMMNQGQMNSMNYQDTAVQTVEEKTSTEYYNDIPKPYKYVKIGDEYVIFAKLTYRYKTEKKKEAVSAEGAEVNVNGSGVSVNTQPQNFADSGLPNPNTLPSKPMVDTGYQPQYNTQPAGMNVGMPGMNVNIPGGLDSQMNMNMGMQDSMMNTPNMNGVEPEETIEYETKTVNIRMKLGDEFNGWIVHKINSQYVEFKYNDESENAGNLFGLSSLIDKIENNKEDLDTKKKPILVRHYFEVK